VTVSLVFPQWKNQGNCHYRGTEDEDKGAIKSGKTRETVNIGEQKTKTKGQSKVEKPGKLSI
jgi:uncharacterized phage protein gp47/JayE